MARPVYNILYQGKKETIKKSNLIFLSVYMYEFCLNIHFIDTLSMYKVVLLPWGARDTVKHQLPFPLTASSTSPKNLWEGFNKHH